MFYSALYAVAGDRPMATSRVLQPIQGPSGPLRIRKGWSILPTLACEAR